VVEEAWVDRSGIVHGKTPGKAPPAPVRAGRSLYRAPELQLQERGQAQTGAQRHAGLQRQPASTDDGEAAP
jgi:hypothetical protein